ncbi:hypothetical protein C8Q77DRAFT_1281081 [Trametes polyzona]|nr:hypothetical protein C8Q77DRAFT_1281081 [Trametes polyzona]
MAQWGQGYQYPMQTGFNPQQQQFQQLAPQPTGFPGQRPGFQQPQQTGFPGQQGFQQPQQTGFPGQQGFQQPQQTGFPGQQLQPQQTGFPGSNFQQRPPPPPVPPIPSQFQQQAPPPPPPPQNVQNSGFLSAQQPNRFLNSSPGLTPLAAQPTGFPGGGGLRPLMPQATGFVDPRLQMMSNTFLPANTSSPYNAAGMPQFQQQQSGFSLQQSFQEHNQAQRGNAAPKIPWALSKAEKKSYDQIFRAWDAGNTGFISGQTALEVFGQSGLDRNDLAKIWALADVENRGKLNLAEFHVAMGLIYRRLNGNEIPDVLPPELVPPSARDLEESVNVLRDILKNDTRARSPAGLENVPESRMRERSFYSNTAGAGGRQDATVYKYKDETPAGGFYQPRSRHVDRSAIRTTSESASPSADLDDMKRQLENTAKMLDRVADENASRTAEDDALEREMSDLKYRVKRVQEDLEYVSRGPRSVAKDEERRKLERELLELMHDKLPDLERRIKDREERREREKREWARERDRRNERFGRYDDRDDRYSSRYDRDRDPYDRPRSAYDRDDRDRERDRDRDYRDRDRDYDRDRDRDRPYSRNRDRDYDRPRSPPTARSPPPPPPEPSTTTSRPPPPAPTPSTAAATKKALTPEERSALARQRIQERMAALGVVAPSPSPKIDTSVEDRLAQEKKEAEEKAKAAEREAEERERIRRERLEGEKALKEGRSPTSPGPSASSIPSTASQVPTPKPTPPPAPAAKPQPPAPPAPRVKPPVPQKRGPAPPPPASRGSAAARAPPAPAPPAAPTPPAAPAPPPAPAVDPEEEALRAREEALRKQREERLARLRALEQEEEEARRQEEARRRQLLEQRTPVVSPPAPPVAPPAPPAPEPQQVPAAAAPPPPPPPPPPAPPAPSSHASTPSVDKSTTNPFSRLMKESPGSGAASPATPGGGSSTNPFFKAQAASPPAAAPAAPPPPPAPPAPAAPPAPPAPSKSPAPPAVRTAYHTAPGDSEDDWEEVQEKDEDDSSDDELDSSRDTRSKLAQQLFGSILPPSRPQSAAPAATTKSTGTPEPSSPAPPPPPPPPPSAPPMANNIPVGIPAPPPPPPGAPPAPAAPAAPVAAPAPTGDRSALLSAIQSGARLRKTQTNDRSAAPVSGRVIGDATPPPHVSAAPRLPSPPASAPALAPEPEAPHPPPMESVRSSNRESVDWYAGLAAEVQRGPSEQLPTTMEEEEPEPATPVPQIQVNATDESNALADVDMGTEYRVRSLYAYQAQRPEELSFSENLILTAHPSKSGSDWWYGTIVRDGKSGFFPKTYVEQVTSGIAHAIYDYNGSNADELPFSEGDELHIVDKSDADWWKAEQGGVVFIVPAAYLALADAVPVQATPKSTDSQPANGAAHAASHHQTSVEVDGKADPAESSDDDNSSDSGSDYVTATDSDSDADDSDDDEEEQSEEARKQERQARAAERQRVLEAAGLIIKKESQPPPRPARTRSHRRRRPAPAVPPRSPQIPSSPLKELPPVPESESANNSLRLDDAFERYEAYRQNHLALNRLSVASFESGTSTTSPQSSTFTIGPPPSLSTSASTSEEPRSHGFLSFFNRSRTPANDGETRTMPVISAPILQREPSPAPGEGGDSAFGSSWASLVDKSALEEIPTTERRRQEAIFELIVTEAAYVRDLQLIVEHFYANVYSLLDEKARTVIFANVEDILLMNTTFLSSLEERQKDCRLYIDKIGDILKTNMANLGVYMDYCVNQATAIKVLQSLRQTNPELSASLQRLRDDPAARNLDLSSYLLVPMQRITRYPLLFKQIIHYTDEGDDRSQIESSRQMAEKVLAHINETIRDQEGRERLKEVSKDLWVGQGRLDLTAPTRYMGPRKLLKEGVLMKAKSGRKLRAFLCSDILVLTEEASKSLYRMPLSLAEVEVRESTGGKDDATFQLAVTYPRGGDEVTLRAATPRESQAWMQAIHTAAKRSRDAQRRAARKSRG